MLHFYDKLMDKELTAARDYSGSFEYVAWSNKPNERFYFDPKSSIGHDEPSLQK